MNSLRNPGQRSILAALAVLMTGIVTNLSCRRANPLLDGAANAYWIAYDNWDWIHFVRDDGGGDKTFTTSDSTAYTHECPVFSPDNRYMFMFRLNIGPEGFQAAVMDLETRSIKVIYQFPQPPPGTWQMIIDYASWSSTSSYVAFLDESWKWRVVSRDGSVSTSADASVGMPQSSWSPQGDKLAFAVFKNDGSSQTFILDVQTGSKIALPDSMSSYNWSPNGATMLATLSRRNSADTSKWINNLCEYSLISHNIRQLTFDNQSACGYYSPNGNCILYASGTPNSTGPSSLMNLYVMDLSTKSIRMVARPSSSERYIEVGQYSWSPDGRKILYFEGGGPQGGDIYVVNNDGTGAHLLKQTINTASWGPRVDEFTP